MANSVDADQTAAPGAVWSEGAVWSGSALFAHIIISETLVFEILGHLLYMTWQLIYFYWEIKIFI